MKDSKKRLTRMGLVTIGLCGLCCLIPILATMFGLGAIAFLSAYVEWIGIVTMIVAASVLGFYYFRKRQAPACDIECACKEDAPSNPDKVLD
jgi:hypothetical protein